ncbi:hypothetical protein LXL04_027793 [Taraxacum kok-saghyz]
MPHEEPSLLALPRISLQFEYYLCLEEVNVLRKPKYGKKVTLKEYNELLIKFYSTMANHAYEKWISKKIIRVVMCDTDFETYEFTLVDLPLLNPNDWISMMKAMFMAYFDSNVVTYFEFAKHLDKRIPTPMIEMDNIDMLKEEKTLVVGYGIFEERIWCV